MCALSVKKQLKNILENIGSGASLSLLIEDEGCSYMREFMANERLIILGGGHIAYHLCRLASWLGFSVFVVDDRPMFANKTRFPDAKEAICGNFEKSIDSLNITKDDYVAVMTRGHQYDRECLTEILSGEIPKYIGMIASRRRGILLLKALENEGFPREVLNQIHTPIGLDINALVIEEIALSIAAQLVLYRRIGLDKHAKGERLTRSDIDRELLEFIVNDPVPKALLVVCESEGSTPAKSGSIMAVSKELKALGTIGGGCAEGTALRKAVRMIGTGTHAFIDVDLNNDIAAAEGMVCGGRMKIYICDLS